MSGGLFADFLDGFGGQWQRVEIHLVPGAAPTALRLTFSHGRRLEWNLADLRDSGRAWREDEITVSPAGGVEKWLVLRGRAVVAELRRLAPALGSGAMGGLLDSVPPMPEQDGRLFAHFANGEDARWQRVELHLVPGDAPDRLRLTQPDGERIEWPLAELRALRDQAGGDEIVLTHAGEHLKRVLLRGAGPTQEIRDLAPNLDLRPPMRNTGRLLKWSGAAVASVALIIFVMVPIMADQLAVFLPPEGEKALGDATFEQIRDVLSSDFENPVWVCDNSAGLAALGTIHDRLNPEADLPYDIQAHVLDDDMVNAFALPGGRIVFFRGLIDEAQSAEEVAAVFAHEIGHVVNRDPTRDALRSAGSIGVLGLLFGDFAGGTVVLFLANQLINAQYSQKAEAGADDYAHDLMAQAGLSPAALGSFFGRLHAEYGDAEGFISHFASHPQMLDRIAAAEAAADGFVQAEPLLTEAEWHALKGVCGEPGDDWHSPPAGGDDSPANDEPVTDSIDGGDRTLGGTNSY